MNQLYIGLKNDIELPRGNFLLIHDEVPDVPRSRIFDPLRHSFNPLEKINYRKACDFVDIIDALFPRGDSTLTKDTGLDHIADALEAAPKTLEALIEKPDKKSTTGHVWAYSKIKRILRSHVLFRVLCDQTTFKFKTRKIFARINRAELGDFDALVLGLFLMSHYKGQIVLPDGGFYLRELHISLIRENRLIAGVNYLNELSPKLRSAVLLMEDKVASGATYDDAITFAQFAGLTPKTNEHTDFIKDAMIAPL